MNISYEKNTNVGARRIQLLVSIVAPMYNEQSSIEELFTRLTKVVSTIHNKYTFEFIFVDDGSTDQGLLIAKNLVQLDPRLCVVELRRNYGQTAALQAGLDVAAGDIIISMDADLQHFPEEIPKFLEKIEEGYDVVCGWRHQRKESIIRRWPSRIANYLIRKATGLMINDIGTTFRAYRKEIIKDVNLLGENHRFVPVFTKAAGAKITEIPIGNIERPHGVSSYGIGRTLNVFIDLFFLYFFMKYLDRPIRIFGKISLLFFAFGCLIAFILGFIWLTENVPVVRYYSGWFTLAMSLFLTSVQLLLTGIVAELLSHVYFSTQQKTTYQIRTVWNTQNIA
jgi:glycosyltransferase involved in cell wall biosynthesis